jgi:hypothetical protein
MSVRFAPATSPHHRQSLLTPFTVGVVVTKHPQQLTIPNSCVTAHHHPPDDATTPHYRLTPPALPSHSATTMVPLNQPRPRADQATQAGIVRSRVGRHEWLPRVLDSKSTGEIKRPASKNPTMAHEKKPAQYQNSRPHLQPQAPHPIKAASTRRHHAPRRRPPAPRRRWRP